MRSPKAWIGATRWAKWLALGDLPVDVARHDALTGQLEAAHRCFDQTSSATTAPPPDRAATSDLDHPYLQRIRVNLQMDFAPLTGLGILAFLGVPRAITLGLGPRAAVGESG